jgi:PAS domain S-box-containing protein
MGAYRENMASKRSAPGNAGRRAAIRSVHGAAVTASVACAVFGGLNAGIALWMAYWFDVRWAIGLIGIGAVLCIFSGFYAVRQHRRRGFEVLRLRHGVEKLQDKTWELRESEERYRSMAEAFGDLVMHRSVSGQVLFVNEPLARLFGKTGETMIGTQFDFVPGVPARPEIGSPNTAREVEIKAAGGQRWLQWIDMPIRDERTGDAVTRTVARDITDHKRAEIALKSEKSRAESANRSKTRFLGMVSHEMRTPLNGILGMTHLMRDTKLTPEQAAFADAIRSSGESLLGLIEDLLDLTLIEADRFEFRPEETDLRHLLEEVCELLAPRAREKEIELACRISPAVPETVMVDAGRIRQVLVNLLGNAVKFTDTGGVLVALEASVRGRNCELVLAIADTGPGMRPSDATRIFQEFEQGDGATTRRHGGAGLGLPISRRIVRHLGGDITVTSRTGKGSTFSFQIAVPACKPAPAGLKNAMSGQNVLVISPALIEADAIAATIGGAGGKARVVRTLGAALEKLRRGRVDGHPYDVIVIDPRVSPDPSRSLRRLKKKAGVDPYSVVLVQPGMGERRDAYLAGGFDGFLVCPVRHASLLRVLGRQRNVSSEYDRAAGGIKPAELANGKLPKLDVLLAEDNDINALLVRSVLQKAGQNVTHVVNGRDAVAAARAKLAKGSNFDLILMDLHMPEMDGISAIRDIRLMEKRRRAWPARILTLSADEQSQARLRSEEAGSDGFVSKPVEPATLVGELCHIRNERLSAGSNAAARAAVM